MNRRDQEKKDIVDFIMAFPGCNSRELLEGTGVGAGRFHNLMRELKEAGAIHRKGNTAAAKWHPGEDEHDGRNNVIARLKTLACDMKRIAGMLEEFSPRNAGELRGAAGVALSWADQIENGGDNAG